MAQTKSTIDFKSISFKEAQQLSEKTGKLIFIDCYTSWCAPCKWMEQNVFVNDSIYKFYNKNFINFKCDMEKGEGVDLRKKYEVASFPTYLFVNAKGDIIHRTASRMEVNEFLNEGKKAANPLTSYSALKQKYEAGDRSNSLLLNYAVASARIDRQLSSKITDELISKITDEELNSDLGWHVIEQLARNENDRLGKYFLLHEKHFETIAGVDAVTTVSNRLGMNTMYQLIREKNGGEFFTKLEKMRNDPNRLNQRNVAMLEMEYYLEINNSDSFVVVANKAMKGILENDDADLSFIARRAIYAAKGNKDMQQEALILARKAVVLNPEEYSNQGTLASICLEMKLKEEGLIAAKKARLLADAITSKIQKLAQALLDKIEQL
jgi:thiol-disulfide isomerase/thioredoxin